jgi:hypothetical protein
MLLVNAIYFKGLWRYPFNESDTKEDDFHLTRTHSARVPFMSMERDLYWSESVEMDSAILRLPYMVSVAQFNAQTALHGECSIIQCSDCLTWCVFDNTMLRLPYMVSVGQFNAQTALHGECSIIQC